MERKDMINFRDGKRRIEFTARDEMVEFRFLHGDVHIVMISSWGHKAAVDTR